MIQRTNEFEVRVTNSAQLSEAKEWIASAVGAAVVHKVREKRAARTGTVTAMCEECGKPSEWPASSMGTTEVCPHCTAYLAQMRETISLTGRLAPEDMTPQMRDEFVDLYRRWKSEQE